MSSAGLMNGDGASFPNTPGSPPWGIYLNNAPVVLADNVTEVSYKKDYTLSDYPVEQGAFQTYDKVELPFDARVTFSCGGSQQKRKAFLDSVQAIVGDLNFYDVLIPEETYSSCNVTHIGFVRNIDNGGSGIVEVEVWLLQIRVTATTQFTQTGGLNNTQQPGGQSAQNNGNTQAGQANGSQSSQYFTNFNNFQSFDNGGTGW